MSRNIVKGTFTAEKKNTKSRNLRYITEFRGTKKMCVTYQFTVDWYPPILVIERFHLFICHKL